MESRQMVWRRVAWRLWLASVVVAVVVGASGCGLIDLIRNTDDKPDKAEEDDSGSESDESNEDDSKEAESDSDDSSKRKKKKRSKERSADSAAAPRAGGPLVPPPPVPKGPPFGELATVPVFLIAKLGSPIRLHMLSLHPHHTVAEVESAAGGPHVDRYVLRQGVVQQQGRPAPAGNDARFAKRGFELAGIDFGRVAALMADAKVQLAYANPEVSHVIVRRPLPFHDDVRWRVYVTGEEGSGSVEYLLDGSVGKIYK